MAFRNIMKSPQGSPTGIDLRSPVCQAGTYPHIARHDNVTSILKIKRKVQSRNLADTH